MGGGEWRIGLGGGVRRWGWWGGEELGIVGQGWGAMREGGREGGKGKEEGGKYRVGQAVRCRSPGHQAYGRL